MRNTEGGKQGHFVKIAIYVLAVLVIFSIGVNVGAGRIGWPEFASENKNLPSKLDYSTVNEVYQDLKSQYDGKLTTSQVLDGLKTGLAGSTGDPYTEYFNPSQSKQLNNELSGTFTGVGAQLSANSQGEIEVVAPLASTPAARAGLQPHDVISAVNGQTTQGLSVDLVVNKIRGPAGSNVTLTIIRDGKQFNVTIKRANITVPSVNYKIINGNIGYLQINQFDQDTAALAKKAAQKFVSSHVKGVILDLRGNPGGEVDAAVNATSLWLPQDKTIMQEKRGNVVQQTYTSNGDDPLKGLPTVVLIDGGSASAAEITAGALHDNDAARLIGTKSFGKGSVQQIDTLSNGGELKVTIAHWYRPDGKTINHIGIEPDQTVKINAAQVKAGQDPQKDAAIAWLNSH